MARVVIDVEEGAIRARGKVDLASLIAAREDRPLVFVGASKKELANAAAEMIAEWTKTARARSVRVSLRGESGPALRTWRAELKRQSLDWDVSKDAPRGGARAIGAILAVDLAAKRTIEVRIAVYSA